MNAAWRILLLVAALALISGCSVVPRASIPWTPPPPAPAPRPLPKQAPAPAPLPPSQPEEPAWLPEPEPVPLPPPDLPPPAPPSNNSAVVALLNKSDNLSAAGQPEAAGASLERALRIEPRNPALWQRLARVRLAQGDYVQAENLAAKSNSLSGSDRRLRAQNWRIIGEARSKRGDRAGARAAFERAEGEW